MPSAALTYEGPPLDPFQGEYRGLVFGEGTDYVIDGSIEGLLSIESRASDPPIPRSDGAFPTIDYAKADVITFPLAILGTPGTEDLRDKIHAAAVAFRLTRGEDHWFRWHGAYGLRRWHARPHRFAVPENAASARSGIWRATIALAMSDPRGYSDHFETRTVNVFAGGAGGAAGWELPDDELPLDITGAEQNAAGGLTTVFNTGTADAWPLIEFQNTTPPGGTTPHGDTTKVVLTNLDTGGKITIETPIAPGRTLTVDTDALVRGAAGPHVHIDGSTRYGHWTPPREPFRLQPGQNRLRLDVTGADAIARLTYRNTHI